ncbi:hypothetical protein FJU08_18230 [Martelella alba]|uniref:Uncharacterized protein n=1 Tax=Martelella alba TaxID=2590451 RepID=A0A506U1R2_9HYPH|nr:hypothetical protein FJU08_18230 [Martelella alba]
MATVPYAGTVVAQEPRPGSQATYEASLAERRYAACDPDNRLIGKRCLRPTLPTIGVVAN